MAGVWPTWETSSATGAAAAVRTLIALRWHGIRGAERAKAVAFSALDGSLGATTAALGVIAHLGTVAILQDIIVVSMIVVQRGARVPSRSRTG